MSIKETLNDPCPTCGDKGHIHFIEAEAAMPVRGESYVVKTEFFSCKACNSEFETAECVDSLSLAYGAYRHKHGYVQPEDFASWRTKKEIELQDIANSLGLDSALLSRFEKGALLDDFQDSAIRGLMALGA